MTLEFEVTEDKKPSRKTHEEELLDEIRELQGRISTLEDMFSRVLAPVSDLVNSSDNYYRLIELYMKYGKISPEVVLPGVKDDISKMIVQVLFERNGQNISQITDAVKAKRGTASRRIIRDKLKVLEEEGVILRQTVGKIDRFHISEEVVKKWSHLLGLNKYDDHPK